MEQWLENALKKLAAGFIAKETTSEYVEEDGKLVLKKRRVTSKQIPPDPAAAKLLADYERKAADMSDEELLQECERLHLLIQKDS